MNAIYFFDNGSQCNSSIKPYLLLKNIALNYESDVANLFLQIINYKPQFLIIDGQTECLNSKFIQAFTQPSPFFVPLVIVLYTDVIKTINNPNIFNLTYIKYEDFSQKFLSLMPAIKSRANFVTTVNNFQLTKFNDILSFLFKINFSIKNQGTIFLKDCIKYCINSSQGVNCSMGEIYQFVAIQNNTNSANIERGIRLAIQAAWEKNDAEKIGESLGVDSIFFKKQPSCRELIVFGSEYLIEQNKEKCFQTLVPVELITSEERA